MTTVAKYRIMIVASILIIAATFLWLWLSEGQLKDFGLNGFTGTLEMAITVFLIDFLQKKREEARLMPQRAVAHEDVRVLVQRISGFWRTAYALSVPDEQPKSLEELLSDDSIKKIYRLLDMDSMANVFPRQDWWSHLSNTLKDFHHRAEVILERHSIILEPTAYSGVHVLAHQPMGPNFCLNLRTADAEEGFPRVRVLGNYCFFTDDYFPTVLALIDWCNREADTIGRATGRKIMRIEKQLLPIQQGHDLPPNMIKPQDLASQIRKQEEHLARK